MSTRYVEGKPLMLSELIELMKASLQSGGDCPVTAGCYMEGIGGPPSITRDPEGIDFDFYGVEAQEDEIVIWGKVQ